MKNDSGIVEPRDLGVESLFADATGREDVLASFLQPDAITHVPGEPPSQRKTRPSAPMSRRPSVFIRAGRNDPYRSTPSGRACSTRS